MIFKNKKIIIIELFLFISLLKRKYQIKDNYSRYKSDKWIIFFTRNPPIQIVDYLFNSLNNWKILEIGNKDTIDKEWHKYKLSNMLVYLSFQDLKNLFFNSLRYISKNSFARKNIGYLFSIQHEAKEI